MSKRLKKIAKKIVILEQVAQKTSDEKIKNSVETQIMKLTEECSYDDYFELDELIQQYMKNNSSNKNT